MISASMACSSMLPIFLTILCAAVITRAQYNEGIHGMASSYGGGGGYGSYGGYGGDGGQNSDGGDGRPKVQLGIRLRIPAFRFELPRFNLPKITISAKIRQPDKPRTINLPEINLDTSSKLAPPGAQSADGGHSGGGGVGYHGPAQNNGNYGSYSSGYGDRTQSFSFSTGEEQSMGRYGGNNQYQQSQVYSSTNVQPSYSTATQPNNNVFPTYDQYANKNPDVGFNSPVYVEPEIQVDTSKNNQDSSSSYYRVSSANQNMNTVNQHSVGTERRVPSARYQRGANDYQNWNKQQQQ